MWDAAEGQVEADWFAGECSIEMRSKRKASGLGEQVSHSLADERLGAETEQRNPLAGGMDVTQFGVEDEKRAGGKRSEHPVQPLSDLYPIRRRWKARPFG